MQRPRLDASIVDTVGKVDGVAAAVGKVSGYAQLVDATGRPVGDPGQGAPTFGESWTTVAEVNPYRLAEGHAPSGPSEIVIDATVRWESMIIALFGTVLGLSVGLFFGWSMVHAMADQGFKSFVVPTGSLMVVSAIAAIATQ